MPPVRAKASSGGATHGSSNGPHSAVRPHRFSSIEYFVATVVTGIPHSCGERDRFLARDRVVADRRQHLQVGREHGERHLEAHLIVALAGAAVRDRRGPDLTGDAAITSSAMHGRARPDTIGYLPSYIALAVIARVR